MIYFKNFIDLNDDEISQIYQARTHQNIVKFSGGGEFSFEDHLNFIKSLASKNDKKYFMIYDESKFIGVINFTNITKQNAEFGIYKNPALTDKGIGSILMQEMLNYAKFTLNLSQIKAICLKTNQIAFNLYKKFGFEIISQEANFYKMQKDLSC